MLLSLDQLAIQQFERAFERAQILEPLCSVALVTMGYNSLANKPSVVYTILVKELLWAGYNFAR
jgi:hypothetical protein